MLKTGMFIGDRYEIIDLVGTGGMADVYKAKDHKLNRFVAIKVMKKEFSSNKDFVARFRDEAQSAAGFIHNNIVSVYDVGQENGIYYIVMELVEGITLKKYIERKGRLTVQETISIAVQVSMGMEAAHNNHIIHRDIKPQNIIISREGKAKVTDFGIAKAASAGEAKESQVMGSVHYTSPEQAKGEGSDEKSDIYSLGITIYEMLTGQVPFDGETTVSVALQHIKEDVPDVREKNPDVPEALAAIVKKCTQRDPSMRYQNLTEVINDLKQSLTAKDGDSGKEEPADPAPEEPETREPVSREEDEDSEVNPTIYRVMSVLGGIAALIIVGVAVFFGYLLWTNLRGGGGQPEPTEAVYDAETQRVMIDLIGKTYEEAKEALNGMNLGIHSGGTDYSDTVEEGRIMSQSYEKGQIVDIHTTVQVVISNGPASFTIPDVRDMAVEDAANTLRECGLVVEEGGYEYNDEIDVGNVISTTPEAGTWASKDDVVTLLVSRGHERDDAEVPNLYGLTQEKAAAALGRVGLVVGQVTISDKTDENVRVGCVVSQSYEPGRVIEEGMTVDFVLNKGENVTVDIPTADTPQEGGQSSGGEKGKLTIKASDMPEDFDNAYITLKLRQTVDGEESTTVIYEDRMTKDDFPVTIDVENKAGTDEGTVIMFIDGEEQEGTFSVQF